MPAKIIPTNRQVIQLNLDRLVSIFKLPSEYLVIINCYRDILVEDDESIWNIEYSVAIGKSPNKVTVPDNNRRGWFRKKIFKTVTRYSRVARIVINPYRSPDRSTIQLIGNENEIDLILALIDKASRGWIFEKGEKKDINLEINVFPESENDYFDIE